MLDVTNVIIPCSAPLILSLIVDSDLKSYHFRTPYHSSKYSIFDISSPNPPLSSATTASRSQAPQARTESQTKLPSSSPQSIHKSPCQTSLSTSPNSPNSPIARLASPPLTITLPTYHHPYPSPPGSKNPRAYPHPPCQKRRKCLSPRCANMKHARHTCIASADGHVTRSLLAIQICMAMGDRLR
jgi:hypothetical protein